MKKLLGALLLSIIVLAGVKCKKDSTSTNEPGTLYFRAEGVNIDGIPASYSNQVKIVN